MWLNVGNTGTEADYLASLKGEAGADGNDGANGLQGEPGITGAAGTNGVDGSDGNTWLFGTAVPSAEGDNGDFYLKTDNWEVYQKAGGNWSSTGNIKGADGETLTTWNISGDNQYSSLAGNVGIGTSTPNAKLNIVQNSPQTGIRIQQDSTSAGQFVYLTNTNNNYAGLEIRHEGIGIGNYINKTSTLSSSLAAISIKQSGTGLFSRGVEIVMDEATAAIGNLVINNGTGIGQYINMLNTGASEQAFVVAQNGTAENSRGIDVFMGENNITDGIRVNTLGLGHGINSLVVPNTTNYDQVAVKGESFNSDYLGYGIGVSGKGGFYGVVGFEANPVAATYGVVAMGDLGASGAKNFIIDYPLDPTNKSLRHYSVESNEITNMYRGVISLDDNGRANVQLPEYFEAINKNVSYQLTSIGTSSQSYISQEVSESI